MFSSNQIHLIQMFVNYKPKLFVSIFDNKQTNKKEEKVKPLFR